jgi:uncharacterized protein (DUF433 family)
MSDLVSVDPDVMGSTPVFKGTRVPIHALFEHIEDNFTLEQFVQFFPTVTLEMAKRVLDESETALLQSR